MRIGTHSVDHDQPVFVIAEIGINHEGDADTCIKMIEMAALAGADSVKLQTIDPDASYVRDTKSFKLFSQAVLSREDTARAFDVARKLGVEPFTTVGDAATLDWVDRLSPVAYKISSGLMTNYPLIHYAARKGRPLLISTGMATWPDIDASVAAASAAPEVGLFHCVSLYPAPIDKLNLAAIERMRDRYKLPTGYSDHALGIEASAMSVAAGACMIEKHFTLDPKRDSYDHAISLGASGFRQLVDRIRTAQAMRGNPDRPLSAEEALLAKQMRRILVARRAIAIGEAFSLDNIALKRPLPGITGLAPSEYDRVLGARTRRALALDEPIQEGDLS